VGRASCVVRPVGGRDRPQQYGTAIGFALPPDIVPWSDPAASARAPKAGRQSTGPCIDGVIVLFSWRYSVRLLLLSISSRTFRFISQLSSSNVLRMQRQPLPSLDEWTCALSGIGLHLQSTQ